MSLNGVIWVGRSTVEQMNKLPQINVAEQGPYSLPSTTKDSFCICSLIPDLNMCL
jgi:hypothetical protein